MAVSTWFALVCAVEVYAAPAPLAPQFSDDFAADTLKHYAVRGKVTWEKGGVTLAGKVVFARRVSVNLKAEAAATLRWPAGAVVRRAEVGFGAGTELRATVGLEAKLGQMVLVCGRRGRRMAEAAVGPLVAPAWHVRLESTHGLVRARAWPVGEREPREWTLILSDDAGADVPAAAVAVMNHADEVVVERLAVRGLKLPDSTPEQRRQLKQAHELADKADRLSDAGRHDEALAEAERAVDLCRKHAPHEFHHAWYLYQLGLVQQARGELELARGLYQQALVLRRRYLPPEHRDHTATLSTLGNVYSELGLPALAVPCQEQAVALRRRVLNTPAGEFILMLANLGQALNLAGELERSRAVLEEGVALARSKKLLRTFEGTLVLHNLAEAYSDLGDAAKARVCYEEVLSLVPPGGGEHGLSRSHALHGLAELDRERGEYDRARARHEEALALRRKLLPPRHPDIPKSLTQVATTLHEMGEYEEAARRHQEALALYRKHHKELPTSAITTLINLGNVYRDLHRWKDAVACHEEALALWRGRLPSLHHNVGLTWSNLALSRHGAGDRDRAWQDALTGNALQARYAQALAGRLAQRYHAGMLDYRRYPLNVLVSLAERTPAPTQGQLRELLAGVLEQKAVSMLALQRRQEAALFDDGPARALHERLKAARQQLADLLLRGDGGGAGRHRAESERVAREVDALEEELGRIVREYEPLRLGGRWRPESLLPALGPNTVLVEFVDYDRWDPDAPRGYAAAEDRWLAALLLWDDGGRPAVRLVRLGQSDAARMAVLAWRDAVQRGRADGAADVALRRLVWEPLAKALPAGTRGLVVAPDGPLALVPLEAVRLASGKYLLEELAVRYVGTGRDLVQPRRGAAGRGALIVAAPAFDAADGEATAGARPPPAGGAAALRFAPLPGFAREAEAVTKVLRAQGGWEVRRRLGAEASEEALREVSRPRLLYCITHGFFLEDVKRGPGACGLRELEVVSSGGARLPSFGEDPRLRSGLALAGANQWHERSKKGLSDGLLTALEVENLDLWGTELVVLSACETGLGDVQVGEGVLGLRRAFQLAGARTVLASLWKVPDAETEQLMTDTLSRWLKRTPPHEALRAAQLEMIGRLRASPDRNRQQAPPLYWAGFICHGQAR